MVSKGEKPLLAHAPSEPIALTATHSGAVGYMHHCRKIPFPARLSLAGAAAATRASGFGDHERFPTSESFVQA